jgi:hypothetical protein
MYLYLYSEYSWLDILVNLENNTSIVYMIYVSRHIVPYMYLCFCIYKYVYITYTYLHIFICI